VQRLIKYFNSAKTCTPETRKVGIEVETLMTPIERPRAATPMITREQSQQIMQWMFSKLNDQYFGVKSEMFESDSGAKVALSVECRLGKIIFELGWNNFELITQAYPIDRAEQLFIDAHDMLEMLCRASNSVGACMLPSSHTDMARELDYPDTLMMPDERDHAWKHLDGPVLRVLGHIASVHYNVDLCSLEEGMRFIAIINQLRHRYVWPDPNADQVWKKYLQQSRANYEPDRYGPAPEGSVTDYCRKLATYKVVMRKVNGTPIPCNPALQFSETPNMDDQIDLFLRSVWWGTRLRVRGDKLVLEIRDVPRGLDSDIRRDWYRIARALDI